MSQHLPSAVAIAQKPVSPHVRPMQPGEIIRMHRQMIWAAFGWRFRIPSRQAKFVHLILPAVGSAFAIGMLLSMFDRNPAVGVLVALIVSVGAGLWLSSRSLKRFEAPPTKAVRARVLIGSVALAILSLGMVLVLAAVAVVAYFFVAAIVAYFILRVILAIGRAQDAVSEERSRS